MSFSLSLWIACMVFVGLVTGAGASAERVASVTPALETRAVFDDREGDEADADDPAIWVNQDDPRQSMVMGTLKRGGLDVYDLQGSLLQHIPGDVTPPGVASRKARYNNADIIYGLQIGERKADVVAVTDRHNDMLRFFEVIPDAHKRGEAPLKEITAPGLPWIFVKSGEELDMEETAYGLAVSQTGSGKQGPYAFVSRRNRTTVARLKVYAENGKVAYSVLTSFDLPETFTLQDGSRWSPCHAGSRRLSQVEGMVVDDFHRVVYLAQEEVGLWKTDVENPSSSLVLMDKAKEFGVPFDRKVDGGKGKYACFPRWEMSPGLGSRYLSADVEGLTIFDLGEGTGYLLASSQGSNEFVVYGRVDGKYIGSFVVSAGDSIDGSERCDGAQVSSVDFWGMFSGGLLVAHDGKDTPEVSDPEGKFRNATNFKFVRWSDIASALGLAGHGK